MRTARRLFHTWYWLNGTLAGATGIALALFWGVPLCGVSSGGG